MGGGAIGLVPYLAWNLRFLTVYYYIVAQIPRHIDLNNTRNIVLIGLIMIPILLWLLISTIMVYTTIVATS